jgi:hypothetical protein
MDVATIHFGGHEWHPNLNAFTYSCALCGWSISAAGLDKDVQLCPSSKSFAGSFAEQPQLQSSSIRMRPGSTSRVWKYGWSLQGYTGLASFAVPNGACLLDVQEQNGELVWWYYVQDTDNTQRFGKKFAVVLTGQPFEEQLGHAVEYVKTIQLQSVPGIVVHVFQLL